ncbi:unnamed protein product [Agarophyton chilense]
MYHHPSYAVPSTSLNLTVLSCEGLPAIKSDRLWTDDRFRAQHDSLKRKHDAAYNAMCNASQAAAPNELTFRISHSGGTVSPCVTLITDYEKAAASLHHFTAMYGNSVASDTKIAPNCYASVSLERNMLNSPLAVTQVKRANHDPFWNCTTEHINIDLLLMCAEMQSASQSRSFMYCQRLRIAVYHDFGFDQEASCSGWEHDTTCDGLLIGEAFLAVADLFANPCPKRHQLKVFAPDHKEISGCMLHIDTKVTCTTAQVPNAFPCAATFPATGPVAAERHSGKGCDADVSQSAADSISLPSGVYLAMESSRSSCKHKCKPKCRTKGDVKCKACRKL